MLDVLVTSLLDRQLQLLKNSGQFFHFSRECFPVHVLPSLSPRSFEKQRVRVVESVMMWHVGLKQHVLSWLPSANEAAKLLF